jgi:hypothetical protein
LVSPDQAFPGRSGSWVIQYSVAGVGGVVNRALTTHSRPAATVAVVGTSRPGSVIFRRAPHHWPGELRAGPPSPGRRRPRTACSPAAPDHPGWAGPRLGGSECAYSRLATHKWRSTTATPPPCKQGVLRVRAPLLHSDPRALVGERADEGAVRSNGGRRVLIALAPALTTVPADQPPGLHLALAFHVDEPHRLGDEVVAQELTGRTCDLDLV